MPLLNRIEGALSRSLLRCAGAPPRLQQAMQHAVFPGGARIRPQLCLAVALACGDDDPALADAMAAALELLHCASLVHDDLPCFDNADTRRGLPSVHRAFGERLAVLSGDALIVMAFRELARAGSRHPERLATVMRWLDEGVGPPDGIVAGQAWECEPSARLDQYQRAKTGALFSAATAGGAAAAGADGHDWFALGANLGEAYQVADDIRDVISDPALLGKPVGQDMLLGRPSSAQELGLEGAVIHFDRLIARAIESIPACPGEALLRSLVLSEARRLVPSEGPASVQRVASSPLQAPVADSRAVTPRAVREH
ncbi:MAG: polyprenyl synthetase family protein [Betaproteobacteria bacterium]|nr:polyprenyl synthetase family protein [Betaproteobacteria bacterium]